MPLPEQYALFSRVVEQHLTSQLDPLSLGTPLKESMSYSLKAGGKRIRPTLLLALFTSLTQGSIPSTDTPLETLFLGDPSPLPAAIALEYIHTYSLIHDDLPAMDNDDLRRGKPTLHKVRGEGMAILAGDGLLTAAFVLLAQGYMAHPDLSRALSSLLSEAALKMVQGQVMDTLPGEKRLPTLPYLNRLVDLKTGALLTVALTMGATVAGAPASLLAQMTTLGTQLGRLFQITDDLLDVLGTREQLGKTPGKDQRLEKLTYVTLLGEEGARTLARKTLAHSLALLGDMAIASDFFCSLFQFIHDRSH